MIVVLNTGEKYMLRSGQNRIGRGDDTDLQVQSEDVSRHHAVITWERDQARVMDMGSTNGTFLNGEKLAPYEYMPVKSGDNLDLGTGDNAVRLIIEDEAKNEAIGAAATVMLNLKDTVKDQPQTVQSPLSPETVSAAYDALASGDLARIRQHWDEGISWWIPGSSPIAGWHRGLEAFIAYLRRLAAHSGGSLHSETQSVLTGADQAAVLSRVSGYRAGYNENNSRKPATRLEVELVQVLRWQNGKIVEGRTAIFGEGLSEYDQFWSALPEQ